MSSKDYPKPVRITEKIHGGDRDDNDGGGDSRRTLTTFNIGDFVEVVKMPKRKQHFNGLVGTIHHYDPTTQKYTICHDISDSPSFFAAVESTTTPSTVDAPHVATNNGNFFSRLSAKFLVRHSPKASANVLETSTNLHINDPKKSDDLNSPYNSSRNTYKGQDHQPHEEHRNSTGGCSDSTGTGADKVGVIVHDDSMEWKTVNRQKKGFGRTKPGQWVKVPTSASSSGRCAGVDRKATGQDYHAAEVIATEMNTDDADDELLSDDEIYEAIELCRQDLRKTLYWKHWAETGIFYEGNKGGKKMTTKQSSASSASSSEVRERHDDNGCEDEEDNDTSSVCRGALKSIVCYGIGNFGGRNRFVTKRSHVSPSLWQLALALTIRDESSSVKTMNESNSCTRRNENDKRASLLFYDPVMTKQEQRILETLGVEIIPNNEMARRTIESDDGTTSTAKSTLFFMPFCPMLLYCNLLHANWDSNKLPNLLVFGNQLDLYIDDDDTKHIKSNTGIRLEQPNPKEILRLLKPLWKSEQMPLYKKDLDRFRHHYQEAFSSSTLHWFPPNNFASKDDTSVLPERPDLPE